MYTKSNKSRHCYLYQFLKEKKDIPKSKRKQWNICPLPWNLISFLLNNTTRKRNVITTMETNITDTTATPGVLQSGSKRFCSWTSLKPVEQGQGKHYQQYVLLWAIMFRQYTTCFIYLKWYFINNLFDQCVI